MHVQMRARNSTDKSVNLWHPPSPIDVRCAQLDAKDLMEESVSSEQFFNETVWTFGHADVISVKVLSVRSLQSHKFTQVSWLCNSLVAASKAAWVRDRLPRYRTRLMLSTLFTALNIELADDGGVRQEAQITYSSLRGSSFTILSKSTTPPPVLLQA